jgi:type I restriction enzyme S subunit
VKSDYEFKLTEIGSIPEDWEIISLGDACSKIGSGFTPRGAEKVYKESGTALIRSQNVYNNSFSKEGLVFLDESTAEEMESVTLEKDDVLLNITGDSVARCCTVPEEILPARVNQHVSIIRTKREQLNPSFLRYYLTSPRMQAFMLSLAKSGGTRNALTKGMIKGFLIPKPAIEEQMLIAGILSAFDSKIELNQQMNKTLESIGQAIFKHWFIDFEFPNEEGKPYKSSKGIMIGSELGEIPKDWSVGKYGDLVEISAGKGLRKDYYSENGKYPIMGANGELGRTDEFLFDEELILTGRVGTLGQVYLATGKIWISDNVLISKPKSKENFHYAFFVLKSFDMESLNRGSTQPLLTQTDLKNQTIALPSKKTLAEFERLLTPLYAKMNRNNSQNASLSHLRDLLLPKLMSGRERVPVEVR